MIQIIHSLRMRRNIWIIIVLRVEYLAVDQCKIAYDYLV